MSDIKSRLIDGLQGQAIKLPAMYGNRWLLIDKENLGWIADRLLSLPGIAIVELPEPDPDELHDFGPYCRAVWDRQWADSNGDEMTIAAYAEGVEIGSDLFDPEHAREIAAALLAAAVQAQEPK